MSNEIGRPRYKADIIEIKKNILERYPNKEEKEKANAMYVFALRLNEEFEKQNINPEEFCQKNYIAMSTFSNYRNGKRIPPIDTLAIIAKELNCSTDYLLGFTDVKSTDQNYKTVHEITGLSDEAITFLKEHKNMDYELYKDRDVVYKYKHIETLNYLLKNEKYTRFLTNLGNYMWIGRDIKESLKRYIINNGGEDIVMPKLKEHWKSYKYQLDRDQAIAKIDIDRSLFKIDEDIRNDYSLFKYKTYDKQKDKISLLIDELTNKR